MTRPRWAFGAAVLVVTAGALVSTAPWSSARAQEESCPPARFGAQLLTPLTGRHPRDAAMVVGLVPGGSLTALPPLMLTRRRREIATATEEIAPGLYRVRADTRRIYGRYRLEGVQGDPEVLFGRVPPSAAPSAPSLDRVERYIVASASGERTEVRAHFRFPIPAGVVAAVAFWGDDATPDLWARAVPTRSETVLFSRTGNCEQLPEGASPPPESGNVRVAFVDKLGQMSAPSGPQSL